MADAGFKSRPAGAGTVVVKAAIVIRTGRHAGRVLEIPVGGEIVIGRGPECDLILWDTMVSRRHCSLKLTDHQGLTLSDPGSTNGTLLNGARVHVAQVPDGSEVQLGGVVLKVALKEVVEAETHACQECGAAVTFQALGGRIGAGQKPLCQKCAARTDLSRTLFGETVPVDEAKTQSDDEDELPLEELDGFALVGELGRTPLGPIYQAFHNFMRRDMLLHFLHPRLAKEEETLQHFLDMGKLGTRFQNSHLIRVFELGPLGDTLYASMDLTGKRSVWDEVRQWGPVTVEASLEIWIAALRAVSYLHQQRHVHGALEPGKLLLGDDGVARIGFYNLFFTLDKELLPSKTLHQYFLAPEQLVGHEPSASCDVYSLGAVIYFALSGKPPHHDVPPGHLMRVAPHVDVAPLPRPEVPPQLLNVLHQSLARNPRRRFASTEEVLAALGAPL